MKFASEELRNLVGHVSDVLALPALRPLVSMPLLGAEVAAVLASLGGLLTAARLLEEGHLDGAHASTDEDENTPAAAEAVCGVDGCDEHDDDGHGHPPYAALVADGRAHDERVKRGPGAA